MNFYQSLLTESFIDYFYFDLDTASDTIKSFFSLDYTNFLCGLETFEAFKDLFSLCPQSELGPLIDTFTITYAGSKYILSEKMDPGDLKAFSRINKNELRELLNG